MKVIALPFGLVRSVLFPAEALARMTTISFASLHGSDQSTTRSPSELTPKTWV